MRLVVYVRLVVLLLISSCHPAWAIDHVRYTQSKQYKDPKQEYYIAVLTLALEESKAEYGDFRLHAIPIEMAQGRTSIMVEHNTNIDVVWRMTSTDLEQKLAPVYVPLLKGLMGYRIGIIRRGEQEKFNKSLTVEQLKKIPFGQGYDWPDTKILEMSHFNVVKGGSHQLLDMLIRNRFDYFPRALHEPWHEISPDGALVVEQNWLIKYHSPLYFFVNKENSRLQQRLAFGLERAVENGKFDQLFNEHPITRDIIKKANLPNRRVVELHNPLLSPQSAELVDNKKLWVNFEE